MGKRDQQNDVQVLVTGANGFVGQHVLRECARQSTKRPLNVVSGIKPGTKPPSSDLEFVNFDLEDLSDAKYWIAKNQPKAVIHLAAISVPKFARDDPDHAWRVNFQATRQLAEFILGESPNTKFIFAGSAEAYGQSFVNADGTAVTENTLLRPKTLYGATKAAADLALGQLSREGLNCIRFRPFNHTGPGQADTMVSSSFAKQIALIELGLQDSILRVGNLLSVKDFSDVRDVASAYVSAIYAERLDPESNAINICSQQGVSIQKILDTLLELSEVDVRVEKDPERMRAGEAPTTIGSNEKIRTLLRWTPKFELRSTMSDLLNDWRGQLRKK